MSPADPNLAKVELVARALGYLRDELVFVGGCAAGLLMSGPATPAARVTYDVDLVTQVAGLRDYHRMEGSLAAWDSRATWRRMRPSAAGVTGTSKSI